MTLKKLMLVVLTAIAAIGVAMAQGVNGPYTPPANPFPNSNGTSPLSQPGTANTATNGVTVPTVYGAQSSDVLGAHLVYGRGCVACHAPHSGAAGNGGNNANDPNTALWGQNLTPLYGQTLVFASDGKTSGSSYRTVTLPSQPAAGGSLGSAGAGATVVLLCLSCHDGNVSKSAMMTGWTVESIPIAGGKAPTFLGNDGSGAGNYQNDHPVGPNANVSCGGGYNWDCTGGGNSATPITMNGVASGAFVNNYGYTVSLTTFAGSTSVNSVTCTSCHDQHSMTAYIGTINQNLGVYPTMFFIKGYYNPTYGSNSVAQFCRQCHGGESNEMHGLLNVPTL